MNHLAHIIFCNGSSTRWAPDPVISGVMGLWGPYRWLSKLRTEVILPYLLGLCHPIYNWIRDPSCIKFGSKNPRNMDILQSLAPPVSTGELPLTVSGTGSGMALVMANLQ